MKEETAAEIIKRLAKDPSYQKIKKEQDRRLKELEARLEKDEQRWTPLIGQELDSAKWFRDDEPCAQERNHEKTKTQPFTRIQGQSCPGCDHR